MTGEGGEPFVIPQFSNDDLVGAEIEKQATDVDKKLYLLISGVILEGFEEHKLYDYLLNKEPGFRLEQVPLKTLQGYIEDFKSGTTPSNLFGTKKTIGEVYEGFKSKGYKELLKEEDLKGKQQKHKKVAPQIKFYQILAKRRFPNARIIS